MNSKGFSKFRGIGVHLLQSNFKFVRAVCVLVVAWTSRPFNRLSQSVGERAASHLYTKWKTKLAEAGGALPLVTRGR